MQSLLIAVVLVLIIGIYLFQPYKVNGESMVPTLHNNERIYVSKLMHTFSYLPDYGDIVILDSRVDRPYTFKDAFLGHPVIQFIAGVEDGRTNYVKRVIGKPGDTITIKDNKVYRNGAALDEPYINGPMNYNTDEVWNVPEGSIFVLGDNRNNSLDSRKMGNIPLDHVLGIKVF
ncbi:signal peptidase I [Paenibacillus albiflavus]|uniref:signal peptidase I n=1 Tax=Paenibacillus albiflavus TaxID=2545760 RepID=UPI0026A6A53B